MAYDFINQNIVASCLIQPHDDDSFYNPIRNQHTGYAYNGIHYTLGVQDTNSTFAGKLMASWWSEVQTGNPYRGDQQNFPTYGLVLLSPVSLVILDQSIPVSVATSLPLWMQFLLGDTNAFANNFDGSIQGFLPASLCYADGIISVTYTPDSGNQPYLPPTSVANITATSITSNVLTVTAGNTFVPGQVAAIAGTAETFLNGQSVTITTANAIQFTANFTNADYTNGADTGTATVTLAITPPYEAPYPNVSAQSNMVVSIDFTTDSVYLDVAV